MNHILPLSLSAYQRQVRALTQMLAIALVGLAVLAPSGALGQEDGSALSVTVRGTTAYATFTLPTPCTAYTLDWGDATREEENHNAVDACIQVLQEVRVAHEYDEDGAYTVVLTLQDGERTSSQTITVPGSVPTFSLADVARVTSEWFDPSAQVADEEYTLYTITHDNGSVITVQVAGFTTSEMRDKKFAEAGYTGDVDALIARATPMTEVEEDTPATSTLDVATLKTLLLQILSRLEELLAA